MAEAEVEVVILNIGDRFRMQKAVGSRQGAKGNYWVSAKVFRAYLAHMEQDAVFQELLAKTENERCLRHQLAASQKTYIELAARTIRKPVLPVRHEIDPTLVKKSIDEKIASWDNHLRYLLETDPDDRNNQAPIYAKLIREERERYTTVTVLETEAGFVLSYNGKPGGTGPFPTLEEAQAWFIGGGR